MASARNKINMHIRSSKYKCLSLLDLKDVYHTIKHYQKEPHFGTLSYIGSASYVYLRMPIGQNASTAIWQSYINGILGSKPDRSK